MKTRVIVGAALVAMLALMLVLGGAMYIAVVTLFGFVATYELATAFRKKEYQPIVLPAYVLAVACPVLYRIAGFWVCSSLYILMVLVTLSCAVFSAKRTAADMLVSLSLFVYPLSLVFCALPLYFAFPRPVSLTAACFALAAPEFCDTMAYFGGTLFGKHKLCPDISPKKTVEGSICATLGGVLFGLFMHWLQPLWNGIAPLIVLLPLGFLCGVCSQMGDLVASKVKRWTGVKDFSSLFPGHGGVMDRIDSILFCAPLTYLVFTICTHFDVF